MNEPINGTKRLYRLKDGRIVAGVCAGLAAYLGIDATLIRLGFALLTVFGGLGALLGPDPSEKSAAEHQE